MKLQPDFHTLTPYDCVFILLDYQVQFALTLAPENAKAAVQNATNLAKVAVTFSIPTILTTVGASSFGGPLLSRFQEVFSIQSPVDRNAVNPWNDDRVPAALEKIGRKKLVVAGLWTDFGVSALVLQALKAGYEVVLVKDACGDVSELTHRTAIQRMLREGAVPMTWMQLLLTFQRQSSSPDASILLSAIINDHAALYGTEGRGAGNFLEEESTGVTNGKTKERGWAKWPNALTRLQKRYQKGS